jgi:hypothetical protein
MLGHTIANAGVLFLGLLDILHRGTRHQRGWRRDGGGISVLTQGGLVKRGWGRRSIGLPFLCFIHGSQSSFFFDSG